MTKALRPRRTFPRTVNIMRKDPVRRRRRQAPPPREVQPPAAHGRYRDAGCRACACGFRDVTVLWAPVLATVGP